MWIIFLRRLGTEHYIIGYKCYTAATNQFLHYRKHSLCHSMLSTNSTSHYLVRFIAISGNHLFLLRREAVWKIFKRNICSLIYLIFLIFNPMLLQYEWRLWLRLWQIWQWMRLFVLTSIQQFLFDRHSTSIRFEISLNFKICNFSQRPQKQVALGARIVIYYIFNLKIQFTA